MSAPSERPGPLPLEEVSKRSSPPMLRVATGGSIRDAGTGNGDGSPLDHPTMSPNPLSMLRRSITALHSSHLDQLLTTVGVIERARKRLECVVGMITRRNDNCSHSHCAMRRAVCYVPYSRTA